MLQRFCTSAHFGDDFDWQKQTPAHTPQRGSRVLSDQAFVDQGTHLVFNSLLKEEVKGFGSNINGNNIFMKMR